MSGPGTLEPIRNLDTVAKVQGTIVSIARIGDRVSKGDILVQIDPAPFWNELWPMLSLALEMAKVQRGSLVSTQANNTSSLEGKYRYCQSKLTRC